MARRTTILCMVMLLAVVAVGGTAYASIHGTQKHDWGRTKGSHPPGCPIPCGDAIFGNRQDNKIYGYEGWDAIWARAGNDVVVGGKGMEWAYGRSGRDKMYGQRGHDHLFGGDGDDRLKLQDGRDEQGHVEQASGDAGRDRCVLDEDTREAIIVTSCETLVIKSVEGMKGATRVARGAKAWERRDFIDRRFYPGTYRRI
jgi:hypothetical protein